MPAILVLLLGGLGNVLAHVVGRVFVLLGLTAVVVTGASVGLEALRSQIIASYTGLPVVAVQLLGLLRVDQAVLIVLSAVAARLALRALGGAIATIVSRPGPGGAI